MPGAQSSRAAVNVLGMPPLLPPWVLAAGPRSVPQGPPPPRAPPVGCPDRWTSLLPSVPGTCPWTRSSWVTFPARRQALRTGLDVCLSCTSQGAQPAGGTLLAPLHFIGRGLQPGLAPRRGEVQWRKCLVCKSKSQGCGHPRSPARAVLFTVCDGHSSAWGVLVGTDGPSRAHEPMWEETGGDGLPAHTFVQTHSTCPLSTADRSL